MARNIGNTVIDDKGTEGLLSIDQASDYLQMCRKAGSTGAASRVSISEGIGDIAALTSTLSSSATCLTARQEVSYEQRIPSWEDLLGQCPDKQRPMVQGFDRLA